MHARQSHARVAALWRRSQGSVPDHPAGIGSDSSSLDNVLELLTQSGRSLPHAISMLIPGGMGIATRT